jgi:hypothetical protein
MLARDLMPFQKCRLSAAHEQALHDALQAREHAGEVVLKPVLSWIRKRMFVAATQEILCVLIETGSFPGNQNTIAFIDTRTAECFIPPRRTYLSPVSDETKAWIARCDEKRKEAFGVAV